jgi:hypothetical protein
MSIPRTSSEETTSTAFAPIRTYVDNVTSACSLTTYDGKSSADWQLSQKQATKPLRR